MITAPAADTIAPARRTRIGLCATALLLTAIAVATRPAASSHGPPTNRLEAPGPTLTATNLRLRINPNNATHDELMLLPRIGPALADAIVAHRREFPFSTIDDLLDVRGIGPATLGGMRPYLDLPTSSPADDECPRSVLRDNPRTISDLKR